MRRHGLTESEIYGALSVMNSERCNPPLPDEEVRTIAKSVARYAPEPEYTRQISRPRSHKSYTPPQRAPRDWASEVAAAFGRTVELTPKDKQLAEMDGYYRVVRSLPDTHTKAEAVRLLRAWDTELMTTDGAAWLTANWSALSSVLQGLGITPEDRSAAA